MTRPSGRCTASSNPSAGSPSSSRGKFGGISDPGVPTITMTWRRCAVRVGLPIEHLREPSSKFLRELGLRAVTDGRAEPHDATEMPSAPASPTPAEVIRLVTHSSFSSTSRAHDRLCQGRPHSGAAGSTVLFASQREKLLAMHALVPRHRGLPGLSCELGRAWARFTDAWWSSHDEPALGAGAAGAARRAS